MLDLGRVIRLALKTDDTVRIGSWGVGLARKAAAGIAQRDPMLALQATQWARCAMAGEHEWPAGDRCGYPGCSRVAAARFTMGSAKNYLCDQHEGALEGRWKREPVEPPADPACVRCGAIKGGPNLIDVIKGVAGR